jgi:4-hydroxybenzoate polyprenyltransferase
VFAGRRAANEICGAGASSMTIAAELRIADRLARSCHPAPTVAVTVFATVLAAVAGNSPLRCVLIAAAVLCGQLSIGWSNDRIDASRDRQVERSDKPIAVGEVGARTVDVAIALAVAGAVALSLALGWEAGLVHLCAVACGWAYNLGLKATPFSWLPYAVAFGALPGVATLALPEHRGPAPWIVAAGALLGIAANLTNALPDLAGDRATGVRGLPHRIGARPSLLAALALLVAATGCVAFGPLGAPYAASWVVFAIAIVASGTGARLFWARPEGRTPFYAIIAVVGLDVILIIVTGHQLR